MLIFFHDVSMTCINQAAVQNAVPAELILAIITVEGGRNGIAMPNKNGSFDLGVMQVNTAWGSDIKSQGYTLNDIQYDSCKNIAFGTWILNQCIKGDSNLDAAIGDYHSHTPVLNTAYSQKVLQDYDYIHNMLYSVTQPNCQREGEIC
jgi:soluble lytic murein transglycosylase-like protein